MAEGVPQTQQLSQTTLLQSSLNTLHLHALISPYGIDANSKILGNSHRLPDSWKKPLMRQRPNQINRGKKANSRKKKKKSLYIKGRYTSRREALPRVFREREETGK